MLDNRLKQVENELSRYLKKYGIKNLAELDKKLQNGDLEENDIHNDFFALDYLEHERERLLKRKTAMR